MAKGIIISGGNGGDNSDDCTVTADKVIAGEKYIGKDTDDDVGIGTLTDHANYTDAVSLGYDSNSARIFTRIPTGAYRKLTVAGYPEIWSKIADINKAQGLTAAKVLAGQSAGNITGTATNDATAEAKYIYKDKTAYVKGKKLTGSMTVSSVVSFSVAAYSTSQVLCTWKNPANGPYGGVIIRYKTGSYPSSVTDGTQGYKGIGTNSAVNGSSTQIIGGLSAGTTYYFRIWMYCDTSEGTLYSGYKETTAKTTNSGRKVFTTSETFTVPDAVRSINIHCTGGGGCGGAVFSTRYIGGGGGGGGYTAYKNNITVNPGDVLSVTVGAGSTSSGYGSGSKYYGGSSIVANGNTELLKATGGGSAYKTVKASECANHGGDGGSGGSGGAYDNDDGHQYSGQTGGSDGANGTGPKLTSSNDKGWGGAGQGKTTREFGKTSGTLYAGGGGGGDTSDYYSGAGGDGGGGRGGPSYTDGSAGTGGGGGGGYRIDKYTSKYGKGGSGNVIITW